MSYTCGAFDATIEDSYRYEDFERDLRLCMPFVLAIDAGLDGTAMGMLLDYPEIADAFGRMTAYYERNFLEGESE